MFNTIYNGLNIIGTVYLWLYPINTIKSELFSLFKALPPKTTGKFDESFDTRVKEIFDDFLKKNNVSQDFKVYQKNIGNILGALTTFKDKAIIVLPNLIDIDLEAFKICFKHEIKHIKDNHIIKRVFLDSTFVVFSMYYLRHYSDLSFISSLFSFFCVNAIFKKIIGTYFEWQADRFAIDHASVDELKGFLRLYKAVEEVSKDSKIPYLLEYLMSTHPTVGSRVNAVHAALKRNNIEYTPTTEEIKDLIELLKTNEQGLIKTLLTALQEKVLEMSGASNGQAVPQTT